MPRRARESSSGGIPSASGSGSTSTATDFGQPLAQSLELESRRSEQLGGRPGARQKARQQMLGPHFSTAVRSARLDHRLVQNLSQARARLADGSVQRLVCSAARFPDATISAARSKIAVRAPPRDGPSRRRAPRATRRRGSLTRRPRPPADRAARPSTHSDVSPADRLVSWPEPALAVNDSKNTPVTP